MSQVVKTTPRGHSLMKVLTNNPYIWIKKEVEEMTQEEAAEIWKHIEPYFSGVAAKSGITKRGIKWMMLLRKMQLIKAKAEG